MNSAYRIIDRRVNLLNRCNFSFARVCHLPDERPNPSTPIFPSPTTAGADLVRSDTNFALLADKRTGEWCRRNATSATQLT